MRNRSTEGSEEVEVHLVQWIGVKHRKEVHEVHRNLRHLLWFGAHRELSEEMEEQFNTAELGSGRRQQRVQIKMQAEGRSLLFLQLVWQLLLVQKKQQLSLSCAMKGRLLMHG